MGKKLVRAMAMIEIIMAILLYLTLNYEFSHNGIIMDFLANTDAYSTLLRLAVYALPGIYLVTGVFGTTFDTKGILIMIGIVSLLASVLTYHFGAASKMVHILSLAGIIINELFILGAFLVRKER